MTRTHYVLLKAFVVTRNLRHWEAKSEQLTRSEKNHSQIQVTQSLFLTLRCLAQNGICFLKAFVSQEICTLGSKIGAIDKNHSQIKVTQSHFVTLSYDWNKMAYVFLKAFAETRNLRH